jgi:hypothetical protein
MGIFAGKAEGPTGPGLRDKIDRASINGRVARVEGDEIDPEGIEGCAGVLQVLVLLMVEAEIQLQLVVEEAVLDPNLG